MKPTSESRPDSAKKTINERSKDPKTRVFSLDDIPTTPVRYKSKAQPVYPETASQTKIGVEIRCFMMLLCMAMVCFSCADRKEKTTAAEISAHFKNYVKLKQNDLVRARGELYAAAYLLHKGHPKSKLWADKVYEMDSTGKVSFSDLLAYEMLVFKIATDNGVPKDILEKHQKVIKAIRQQIEALKAEGKDPKAVWTKAYIFDFPRIPNLNWAETAFENGTRMSTPEKSPKINTELTFDRDESAALMPSIEAYQASTSTVSKGSRLTKWAFRSISKRG